MVDMHIHTIYSDGDKTIEEVLKKCEEKKLEYISITDHNTCKGYNDEFLKNNTIFSGKIVMGAEMNATLDNRKRIETRTQFAFCLPSCQPWCIISIIRDYRSTLYQT